MQHNPVSYQSLLEKFETTKKELGETEETIRRITGRDPDRIFPSAGTLSTPGRPSLFLARKRPRFPIGKPQEREATPEEEEEESPDEDAADKKKPAIQSTVVAATKDVKSRKDVIHEQNINSKVTARNRRMMGLVLGTLQKFQHEEKKRKEQVLKKAEIEQKVEAAAAEEKEQMKKEKEDLFISRREKLSQLRCLEKKLEIAQVHEAWEQSYRNMLNFITTKAKPHICFLPSVHNNKSKKCLEESKTKVLEILMENRENTERELAEIQEWYRKETYPTDAERTLEEVESLEMSELTEEAPELMQPISEMPPQTAEIVQPVTEVAQEVPVEEDEAKTTETDQNLGNEVDQEFEPIYD